jgi:hypothetical protein
MDSVSYPRKIEKQGDLCRGHGRTLPGAFAATLFPMAKFARPVQPISLKNTDKLPLLTVAATHGVVQEDQAGEVQEAQSRGAEVG